MKRKKDHLEVGSPAVSLAALRLSLNHEKMIFPSHNGLSRQINPSLDDQVSSFLERAPRIETAFTPRSSIVSGVI